MSATITSPRATRGQRSSCTPERLTEDALARIAALNPRPERLHHDHGGRRARERAPGGSGNRGRPLPRSAARHPDFAQGPDRRLPGVPTTAASRLREGRVARRDAPDRLALARGRRRVRRQDQPSRVRVWHDERRFGAGARHAILSTTRAPRADRAAGRPSRCARACRSPASAPTPADRFAFRPQPAASSA